jgi:thiamine biosynthesis lipoprotein
MTHTKAQRHKVREDLGSVFREVLWRLCCVLILSAVVLQPSCATTSKTQVSLERFEFEEPQMGVPFRMVVYATNVAHAERAVDAAFARIAELNAIMSDYETESELSKLSRSSEEGSPEVRVSGDLWRVLKAAQELARETDGAFDITIGPCAALWRKARREEEFPDATRLENAREKVGYENLLLNERKRTARLVRFGMRLDLGAIAKGYAADEALKVLRQFGIQSALVAASGDLALGDAPPGAKGWRVEIVGYDAPNGSPSAIVELENCGVATSGDLFQRVEINGVRYSHIVNPFTCVGMTNHALATVIAKDSMTADSLATVMTIAGTDTAFEAAGDRKAAARVVRMEDGKPVVKMNARFRKIVKE